MPGYGILMIYAHPKTGKSILSQQLAHSLGCNGTFLGQDIARPLKVLYVQSDLPEMEWAQQMKDLGICSSTNLPYKNGWYTVWLDSGWLGNPRIETELSRHIESEKFDLIMYDSLMAISGWADVDDKKVVGNILTSLRRISKKPTWLIHHKRKGSPGVPDRANVAAAGHHTLGAGVSVLFDLSASRADSGSLIIMGRFIRREIDLIRGPKGIWLPKTDPLGG